KECQSHSSQLTASCIQLQNEIQELCHKFARLNSMRLLKEKQSTQCSEMLSKIRSLPVEILTDIFEYCMPEMPYPDSKSAPLLLCQVTSSWRQIALHLPRLWNHLCYPFAYRAKYNIGGQLSFKSLDQITSLWLNRSHNLPLAFSL
ncbi:hypothetical protein B0H34DRAFT_629819, partial [Crassisporium funariophilum]